MRPDGRSGRPVNKAARGNREGFRGPPPLRAPGLLGSWGAAPRSGPVVPDRGVAADRPAASGHEPPDREHPDHEPPDREHPGHEPPEYERPDHEHRDHERPRPRFEEHTVAAPPNLREEGRLRVLQALLARTPGPAGRRWSGSPACRGPRCPSLVADLIAAGLVPGGGRARPEPETRSTRPPGAALPSTARSRSPSARTSATPTSGSCCATCTACRCGTMPSPRRSNRAPQGDAGPGRRAGRARARRVRRPPRARPGPRRGHRLAGRQRRGAGRRGHHARLDRRPARPRTGAAHGPGRPS